MGNMMFRKMQIKDYEAAYNLWKEVEGVGLSSADEKDNIEKYLKRNEGLSFVAEQNGKVIGAVLAGHDGRRGYIHHLAVDEDNRSEGIGSTLVEKCIEQFKNEGIEKCHIAVFGGNNLGRKFWNTQGWTRRDDLYMYFKEL